MSWATPIPRPPTATQTDAGRPGTTGKPRVRYGEQIWHGRIHTVSSLSGFVRHTQVFLDRIALCHPEPLGSTAAPRSGFRAVNQFEPVTLLKQYQRIRQYVEFAGVFSAGVDAVHDLFQLR